MENLFKERTEIVIGKEGVEKLKNSNILVFGLGGVGSFVVESLVRAGIGNITIVDFDKIDETNINRQLPALHSTIGRYKADVVKERAKDINPDINVKKIISLYDEDTSDSLLEGEYDYVVDAIDMMKSKLHLIESCSKKGMKLISSMGMGNKLDPTLIRVGDINKTEMCPMARRIRGELKKKRIKRLKVVYSLEKPRKTGKKIDEGVVKNVNGSVSFVPSCAGLIITSVIVRDLIEIDTQ
ncbi:tRNA threonylcarbamoyladenosine dehydratase [Peptostreptococcus faecalis]|uniref:tRNA threonylcarbamoyladenosine dehydratase n=1 Tax=Peptostreptococcus faecalis TaxID=2045015 RepID=UPI000C7C350D|nr:tRNA threonylcarbamoyladenosine dehydratase [Peptostreptococcus faecalis]